MLTVTGGTKISAREEFQANWPLLLSALLGPAFMSAHAFTLGVFMPSWQKEFGWKPGQISAAVSFTNVALIIFPPLVGRLIDRFGARRPTLWFLGLLPLAFVGLTQVGPELWTLYAAYFFFGAIGAGCGFVPFTRAISEYFDKGRGLALGIACSATSLCALVSPVLTNQLLKTFGWRAAWLGLAVAVALIWPIVFVGLKDVRTVPALLDSAQKGKTSLIKGFGEFVRSRNFCLIAFAFMLVTFAALGLVVQTVSYLRSLGFSRDQAVGSATGIAAGLALARVAGGLLLDRIFAPTVFKYVCLTGILGCAGLLCGQKELVISSVIAIGAVMGAEGDIMAYLASRYFGLENYAKAYGLLYGMMGFGSMSAPVINGYILDITGSYTYSICLAGLALLASATLMHFVPPYPSDRPPLDSE